jgi:hypothetical protein
MPCTHRCNSVFLFLVGALLLFAPHSEAEPSAAFLWRIESISAEAVHQGASPAIGSHLLLRQNLHQGESGWTEMKIAIPTYWCVRQSLKEGDKVVVELEGGSRYALQRDNVSKVANRVLGIGKRLPESEIEAVWNQFAQVEVKPANPAYSCVKGQATGGLRPLALALYIAR